MIEVERVIKTIIGHFTKTSKQHGSIEGCSLKEILKQTDVDFKRAEDLSAYLIYHGVSHRRLFTHWRMLRFIALVKQRESEENVMHYLGYENLSTLQSFVKRYFNVSLKEAYADIYSIETMMVELVPISKVDGRRRKKDFTVPEIRSLVFKHCNELSASNAGSKCYSVQMLKDIGVYPSNRNLAHVASFLSFYNITWIELITKWRLSVIDTLLLTTRDMEKTSHRLGFKNTRTLNVFTKKQFNMTSMVRLKYVLNKNNV